MLLFQAVFTSKHPEIKSVSATKLKAKLPDLGLFGLDTTGRIFEILKSPNAQHHTGMRKHFCQITFHSFITMSQEKSCCLTRFQKVYCISFFFFAAEIKFNKNYIRRNILFYSCESLNIPLISLNKYGNKLCGK